MSFFVNPLHEIIENRRRYEPIPHAERSMDKTKYKVQVTWRNGEQEFVTNDDGTPKVFDDKIEADKLCEFFKIGMDPEDFQSIAVVKAK